MSITFDLDDLPSRRIAELQQIYFEVFGETTAARNKGWLVKRIAWRAQANAQGGLTDRIRQRAAELANDADLRLLPPRTKRTVPLPEPGASHDRRLPPPGSQLTRKYKGQTLQVTVLTDGFDYLGTHYTSLSAVAKAITGSHCNGFLFFRLTGGDA